MRRQVFSMGRQVGMLDSYLSLDPGTYLTGSRIGVRDDRMPQAVGYFELSRVLLSMSDTQFLEHHRNSCADCKNGFRIEVFFS
jgi:hypothetical protein